jgi:hypothetical protein
MTYQELIEEASEILESLVFEIGSDDRASNDPDDIEPGMSVTFGTDSTRANLLWQSGDNCYTGACYSVPFWGVVSLYRNSDIRDTAVDAIDQIMDQIAD